MVNVARMIARSLPLLRALLLAAAGVGATASSASHSSGATQSSLDEDATPEPGREGPRLGWQVKRQNTGRGTPGESTKTTLRFEAYPADGAISLVRFDVPLPDGKTDFEGSPLNPRLGDVKFRLVGRPLHWGSVPWSLRAELTFPTANPESLGGGKLQLMLGARTSAALPQPNDGEHRLSYGVLIQQNKAIAGNPGTKDVNYTKAEFELLDTWRRDWTLKATLKPVIDWVVDGETGAVFELEGGVSLAGGWRWTLMLGARAWGEPVASTYGKRIELSVGRRY